MDSDARFYCPPIFPDLLDGCRGSRQEEVRVKKRPLSVRAAVFFT